MKTTKYKVIQSAGKFHVKSRPPGFQYFEYTGHSFYSKADADHWIKAQENAKALTDAPIMHRIDGNPRNNSPANLRTVELSENRRPITP